MSIRTPLRKILGIALAFGYVALVPPAALAAALELVTVKNAGGGTGNAEASGARISANARYVVFESLATDLVAAPADTGAFYDLFRRDVATNTTQLVTRNAAGTGPGNGDSYAMFPSSDGNVIAFLSYATDLTNEADTNGSGDIFIRDMAAGTTTRVSSNLAHTDSANGNSYIRGISADGRYVLFESDASNLTATPDTNAGYDLFAYDRQTGAVELLSVNRFGTAAGNRAVGDSTCMSPDGRYVAFMSFASDLTATPDSNNSTDVFVRDRVAKTTKLVSVNAAGTAAANGDSSLLLYARCISDDGRYVAFESAATDLSPLDADTTRDAYVRDTVAAQTALASVNVSGTTAAGGNTAWISADGRYVAFQSAGTQLVTPATSGTQLFVRDRVGGTTRLVSRAPNGAGAAGGVSYNYTMTADAKTIVFDSAATNLAGGADTNAAIDVFVWDAAGNTVSRLSSTAAGGAGNGWSTVADISPDGRTVVFDSLATDLATPDANGSWDLFLVRTRLFANGFE